MYLHKHYLYLLILFTVSAHARDTLNLKEFTSAIVNETPQPYGAPSVLKIDQAEFNQVISEYEVHRSLSGDYSLTITENPEFDFYITHTQGQLKGMAYDHSRSQGYLFKQDPESGEIIWTLRPRSEIYHQCGDEEAHRIQLRESQSVAPPMTGTNSEEILSLESQPQATHVLYLDFDGESTLPGWTGYYAQAKFVPDTLIHKIWKAIVDDFAPYDVNITTNREVYDQHDLPNKGWIVFAEFGRMGWLGVAHAGSYGTGEPVLVDLPTDYNQDIEYLLRTPSHEAGHGFSLMHDGKAAEGAYYKGHGEFTPIMGSGPNTVSHWSLGDYPGATNQENDTEIIESYLGARSAYSEVSVLDIVDTEVDPENHRGMIHNQSDVDTVRFHLDQTGEIILSVDPIYGDLSNLDVGLELRDAQGQLIQASAPIGDRGAQIALQASAGDYQLIIDGVGELSSSDGFSDYSSFGQYQISGRVGYLGPQAQFEVDQGNCVGDTLQFINLSLGTDAEYLWSFEGAEPATSTEAQPRVSYPSRGVYQATLEVTNAQGSHTYQQKVHVGDIPTRFIFPSTQVDSSFQTHLQISGTEFQFGFDQLKSLNDTLAYYDYCSVPTCYELDLQNIYPQETCGRPEWESGADYPANKEVYHQGWIYKNSWWSQGEDPTQGSPWSLVMECGITDSVSNVLIIQSTTQDTLFSTHPVEVGEDHSIQGEFCVSGVSTGTNQAPIAREDWREVSQGDSLIAWDVLLNDSDPDGDVIDLIEVYSSHGQVEIVENQLNYRSGDSIIYPDSIRYIISDGLLNDTTWAVVHLEEGPTVGMNSPEDVTVAWGYQQGVLSLQGLSIPDLSPLSLKKADGSQEYILYSRSNQFDLNALSSGSYYYQLEFEGSSYPGVIQLRP